MRIMGVGTMQIMGIARIMGIMGPIGPIRPIPQHPMPETSFPSTQLPKAHTHNTLFLLHITPSNNHHSSSFT
jgi:hypothetical protein